MEDVECEDIFGSEGGEVVSCVSGGSRWSFLIYACLVSSYSGTAKTINVNRKYTHIYNKTKITDTWMREGLGGEVLCHLDY